MPDAAQETEPDYSKWGRGGGEKGGPKDPSGGGEAPESREERERLRELASDATRQVGGDVWGYATRPPHLSIQCVFMK